MRGAAAAEREGEERGREMGRRCGRGPPPPPCRILPYVTMPRAGGRGDNDRQTDRPTDRQTLFFRQTRRRKGGRGSTVDGRVDRGGLSERIGMEYSATGIHEKHVGAVVRTWKIGSRPASGLPPPPPPPPSPAARGHSNHHFSQLFRLLRLLLHRMVFVHLAGGRASVPPETANPNGKLVRSWTRVRTLAT